MPMNARLLNVGLLLLTVGLAGCTSTTPEASSARQDEASIAASPVATSSEAFSEASSASSASIGPSSEMAPEAESAMPGEAINISPDGATTAPNNDECDQGLSYACGDAGPGGGVVFYASSTSFRCGPDMASSCNFLEVAPNGWNGSEVDCPNGCGGSPAKTSDYGSKGIGTGRGYAYCSGMGEKNLIPNASELSIGAGYANTQSMVANCVSNDAGQRAQSYAGGGLTDWYLPSLDELNALYYYPNRDAIGGFAAGAYWSSTQYSAETPQKYAYLMYFGSGKQNVEDKSNTYGVRPVRAF